MAQLYKPNGPVAEVVPNNGETFTLEELQNHIGGYIELIRLPRGLVAYCDEDGYAKRLPSNKRYNALYGRPVVGNVIVGTRKELIGPE